MIYCNSMDLFGYKRFEEMDDAKAGRTVQYLLDRHWKMEIVDEFILMSPAFSGQHQDGITLPLCSFVGDYGVKMIKFLEMAYSTDYKVELEQDDIRWQQIMGGDI